MSSRNQILAAARAALSTPNDAHVRHAGTPQAQMVQADRTAAIRSWLPFVGPSYEDQKAVFAECSGRLKTRFETVQTRDQAVAIVQSIAKEEAWTAVAAHHAEAPAALASSLGLPVVFADNGYDKDKLAACEGGISGCLALIAQTGSVFVTPDTAGGRALSVIPPHHVVIAHKDQMVSDLPAAWELLHARYGANLPSFTSIITGPSRSGDIERILVLGAHGPKKLTVILVEG